MFRPTSCHLHEMHINYMQKAYISINKLFKNKVLMVLDDLKVETNTQIFSISFAVDFINVQNYKSFKTY